MKYITTKVILLADHNYPVVQIVLVTYNAPYHNVCGIPYLASFSKKITFNLMNEHGIEYVLPPLNDEQINLLPDQYNCNINNGHLQITFNEEKLHKRRKQIKRSQRSINQRTQGRHRRLSELPQSRSPSLKCGEVSQGFWW